MADDDLNPYASPKGAAEPAGMTAPEIDGVWRDGDELVIFSGWTKIPKACWVTNRTGLVLRNPLVTESPLVIVALLLLHVPAVGIVLSIIAALALTAWGRVPRFPTLSYLTWWLWIVRTVVAVGVSLSLMVGLMVGLRGLLVQYPWALVWAVPVMVLQAMVYYYRDRVLLRLWGGPAEKGAVRVRGVHPGYLDRLPEFSREELDAKLAVRGSGIFGGW